MKVKPILVCDATFTGLRCPSIEFGLMLVYVSVMIISSSPPREALSLQFYNYPSQGKTLWDT